MNTMNCSAAVQRYVSRLEIGRRSGFGFHSPSGRVGRGSGRRGPSPAATASDPPASGRVIQCATSKLAIRASKIGVFGDANSATTSPPSAELGIGDGSAVAFRHFSQSLAVLFGVIALATSIPALAQGTHTHSLNWNELPPLPNTVGVAGPFAGVHNNALIVAGGANFAPPVWESEKEWHAAIHVLVRDGDRYQWKDGGKLPRPTGYGAAVSTPQGVVCMGGNDAGEIFDAAYLLQVDAKTGAVTQTELPSLPRPCAYSSATAIGDVVYLIGGQSGLTLDTAMNNVWSLDMSNLGNDSLAWTQHEPMPAPSRAFNITVAQHDGYHQSIYVISGRRQQGEDPQFLKDVWQFTPSTGQWRQRSAITVVRKAASSKSSWPWRKLRATG